VRKDSRIYIAGHTGMVGSAITRRLNSAGYSNLILRDLEDLDLTNQADTNRFFEAEKPEYVIDAAARVGGIVANNTFRAQFIYDNIMIENNLIHQSYVHGVKKLVFLGSSCIYPKFADQPIKEEYFMTGALEYTNEPYAIAKISGIKMCEAYFDQYGSNFLSVMPTNLYGPNDNYNLETSHVLPALIRKMHLGKCLDNGDFEGIRRDLDKRPIGNVNGDADESLIIDQLKKNGIIYSEDNENAQPRVKILLWGTGTPKREFLYVDDLADAVVYLAENKNVADLRLVKTDNGRTNAVYSHLNIGCGEDISIMDLAYIIKETIGFKGDVEFDHTKPDGTPRKLLDVSRLFNLGWKPSILLEQGIRKVYRDYLDS